MSLKKWNLPETKMLDAFIGEQKGKRYEYKIKHMREASTAITPKGQVSPAET